MGFGAFFRILSPMRLPFRHPGVSFLEPLPPLAGFQPVFPPPCLGIIGNVFNMNQPKRSPIPCSRNPTLHMIGHAFTKIMGAAFIHVRAPVSKQNIYTHGRPQIIKIHAVDRFQFRHPGGISQINKGIFYPETEFVNSIVTGIEYEDKH